MTLNRRHFLGASGALILLPGCQTSGIIPASPARQIDKIGIQTYTLREAMGEDFVGTLQMIKDVGYDYVELNGRNFAERSPADLRLMLDDIGLPAPISHVDYDSLASRPDSLGDAANVLGCEYVILPWVGDDQRTMDAYKGHAAMLNKAAETLKPYGVKVGYHNHQFEFFDLGGGQTGMEILLSETDPTLVDFELDLFWASLAGVDIVALFEKHPGRFKMCHIKDMAGDPSDWRSSVDFETIVKTLMVNVGEGAMPFESYFAANETSGMQYFIAEHDNPPKPFRQSIETSYNSIKNMRF